MKKKVMKTLKTMKEILWGNERVRKDLKAEIYQDSSLIMVSVIVGYNIPFLTGQAQYTREAYIIEAIMVVALFIILYGVHKETKHKLRLKQLADI